MTATNRAVLMILLTLAAFGCKAPDETPKQDDLLSRKQEMQKLDPGKKDVQRTGLDDTDVQGGIESGVPEGLLARIRKDAAERAGVTPADVRITSAQAVVWPDGGLGCPVPDQVYAQVVVPGFHVLAAIGLRKFDYRAASGDQFRLCDSQVLHRPDIRQ